jgi:hypothetical protein
MTDIDFQTFRGPNSRRDFSKDSRSRHSKGLALRRFFCLSSLVLIGFGAALLIAGALCRSASTLPEWIGIALMTAGMVVMIFVTGRTAKTTNSRKDQPSGGGSSPSSRNFVS